MGESCRIMEKFEDRKFVDVGRARVCYRRAGAGSALVFLHGFPLSGLTWRKVVPWPPCARTISYSPDTK